VISHSLKVSPGRAFREPPAGPLRQLDGAVRLSRAGARVPIEVDLVADMTVYNPFDFFVEDSAEHWPFDYPDDLRDDLVDLPDARGRRPALAPFLGSIVPRERPDGGFPRRPERARGRTIGYVIRMEPGVQTPEETLERAKGSCRDTGWLLVQILRHLGFAARFVSGYLIQLKPDVKALDGPSGTDHDFTDLHAWVEVYLPGAGWIGLDPTSGLLTGESHIPLAATPHYRNAAPISGLASPPRPISLRHEVARWRSIRGSPSRSPTRAGRARRWAKEVDAALTRATCG
jgi:transglutaminase-like putative cysteine protease